MRERVRAGFRSERVRRVCVRDGPGDTCGRNGPVACCVWTAYEQVVPHPIIKVRL